jgi:hypothetical protein
MLFAVALAVSILPEGAVPYRQPQLAVDGQQVAVAFGSGNAVHFASSVDGGATFSSAVKVAEEGKLSLGRHRGPRIAISGRNIVISAVVGEKGGGADGDVRAWRSTDGGKTWSAAVRVNDVAGAAREGLHAMSAGGGVVFAAWLDLRDKGTRLYGSVSKDGGATWSKNALVYESPEGHICECCHPSVKVNAKGEIAVMWRNWLGGSRDMYVAWSKDKGATFAPAVKQGSGTWPLNACPMDGGDIAFNAHGKVWSAWRRDGSVFVASPDGKEKLAGPGKDPAFAVSGSKPVVAWTEKGVRLLSPDATEPVVLDPAGAFVHLAGSSQIYAAWESGNGIKVARVP